MPRLNLIWHPKTWDDYIFWQNQDRKTLKRINALLTDIERVRTMVLDSQRH